MQYDTEAFKQWWAAEEMADKLAVADLRALCGQCGNEFTNYAGHSSPVVCAVCQSGLAKLAGL